jgi:hypothetical protein
VCIPGHHDGYITWDDYLANEAKLAANRTNAGARPPREGLALCQGIIWCGSCARQMSTRYHRDGRAAYECSSSRADRQATPSCRSITASTVDDIVVERLLDALSPAEVAYAHAAADEVSTRRCRAIRAAELAAERARYEADRAERAFHAAEPENRLATRSPETRWEAKLAALAEAEAALQAARDTVPALPDRATPGVASGQDQDRVLPGRETAGLVRPHRFHVPWVYVPRSRGGGKQGRMYSSFLPRSARSP